MDYRKKISKWLYLTGLILFSPLLHAQIDSGGQPYSFDHPLPEPEVVGLPYPNMKHIEAENKKKKAAGLPQPFGIVHDVNFKFENSGSWTTLPSGDRIWQLAIISPGAQAISLRYENFFLPEGALLFVYNKDKSQVKGALTARNNRESGVFGTSLLLGDELILEYYEPVRVKGQGSFTINKVVHAYRGFSGPEKDFGDSGACQVNINCAEGLQWQDEKRGIARMSIINRNTNEIYWGTGTLMNNTAGDRISYLLTSSYYFPPGIFPDLQLLICYWDYESPVCNNVSVAPSLHTTVGAIEYSVSGGTILLRLLENTPRLHEVYNVYFNGWSRTNQEVANGTGIHHPQGDVKKIAIENDSVKTAVSNSNLWEVKDWDRGSTEEGSIGSPLFDPNGRVIGILTSPISSACSATGTTDNNNPSYYIKMNVIFPDKSSRLDPDNTGKLEIDGIGSVCQVSADNNLNLSDCAVLGSFCSLADVIIEGSTITSSRNIHAGQVAPFNARESTYEAGRYVDLAEGFNTDNLDFFEAKIDITCNTGTPASVQEPAFPEQVQIVRPWSTGGWNVFPNPATQQLTIAFSEVQNFQQVNIQVFDFAGRMVLRKVISGTFITETLDVSGLASGTYYIRIFSEGGTMYQQHFVKIEQ